MHRLAALALAALSGAALLVAHPPFDLWWMSFTHAPLLVVAIWVDAFRGVRPRGATLGALAGLAAFAPMLSWLIAPAGYVGWGLLVAVQVAWFALAGWLLSLVRDSRMLPVAAGIVFAGIDAWRGTVPLNGFEWGAIAYAHTDASWLLPVARVGGARAITFLVVVIGVAALLAIRVIWHTTRYRGAGAVERELRSIGSPAVTLVAALLVSALAVVDAPEQTGALDVLVAQGNDIRHWEQADPDPPVAIARALRDVTLEAMEREGPPDVAIWPESAIDRDPDSPAGRTLAPLIDEAAAAAGELIAGTTLDGPDPAANRYVAASRYVDGFDEIERYTKRRLVPFGEYVPARPLVDWFPPLEQVSRDALPGEGPDAMTLSSGERVAVIICFETLFTDLARTNVLADGQVAQLLVTVTNNASFRDSALPAQHLHQSRLRAVETGRWVVHAALSGSSAFISPDGVIHDATEVFTRTTIRREVGLVDDLTPYLRAGDVVGWGSRGGVILLAVGMVAVRRRQRLRTGADDVSMTG